MKKLNITVQSDYEFPLAEATRKQCLYETIISNSEEDTCELWVITNNSNFITENVNVNVRGINKRELIKEYQNINKFDLVNFIGNIGFYSMLVSVMYKGPKELTITDGGVFSSTKKRFLIRLLSKMFYRLYEKINIYTEYQKKLLLKENKNYIHKIEKIKPIVTSFESEHESKKSDKFIIFYMGYLSKSKGSNILLSIIKTMIAKYKNIQFKFALSGQKSDKKMIAELMLLKKKYAENIIITGKVNPFDELSKSDLYYYCLKRHSDTYAFPFSLYESLQVGTPIIGSDLAGFKEFFDSRLLCSCNKLKVIEFIDKIYQDKYIQKNISKKNLKDLNPRVRKLETL